MKRQESLARRERRSSGLGVWSIIGSVALVAVAVGLLVNLPDIKRYIKISTM